MKRIGNLYNKIVDIDNIKLAHKNARKGKTHYTEVKQIDGNIDYYCTLISDMLVNKTFKNSEYEIFIKNDKGKERTIYKLPYFPDRIVHHAIMQVLEPIWKKIFIKTTYQSIKGRGVHKAKNDVFKTIQSINSSTVYYGQLDIKKFYPSVDTSIMFTLVTKKIKCKDTQWLLAQIIFSMDGLPIGNYLSQYLGNLYLTYFDHYIKETLKVKHYFRYCDDIVILSNSHTEICENIKSINKKLQELNVEIKGFPKIDDLDNGLDFLGFVFKPRCILLRKRIADNFKKSVRRFRYNPTEKEFNSIISYNGWMVASDSYNLWNRYVTNKLKLIVHNIGLSNKVININKRNVNVRK